MAPAESLPSVRLQCAAKPSGAPIMPCVNLNGGEAGTPSAMDQAEIMTAQDPPREGTKRAPTGVYCTRDIESLGFRGTGIGRKECWSHRWTRTLAVPLRESWNLSEPDCLSVMREHRAAYFPEGYCEDVLRKASESGPSSTSVGSLWRTESERETDGL